MKAALATIVAITLAAASAWARDKQPNELTGKVLYRYTDQQGIQVLDHQVPPHLVDRGYEILSLSGRVLKVVPPKPSGEALAEQQRREEQAQVDRDLLRRYTSVADIESARSRKLATVEQDMAILGSNIASLKLQIEREETAAARAQRNGGAVSPERRERIASLTEEVALLQERVAQREQEAERIEAEFDQAARRYGEISRN
ncbi:hypothetical protein [Microbulbifer sp. 2201CG32-9]|uniref:hypothetical protein n=1 Tax=unclassified Microbulbifer TaxID=2619833 RepID=UPI00345BCBAC